MRATSLIAILILVLGGSLLAWLLSFPGTAIYVTVVAVSLAVALQKYVASFFGFFLIRVSRLFEVGDRIRMGNIKGDVKKVGLFHFILEEVGEDEKMGGELTGRLLHIPNLLVLDQPVLNYSKDYSARHGQIHSDYIFDEIRIPLTTKSDVEKASALLEGILKAEDGDILAQAQTAFRNGYPDFMKEAMNGPRVLVHIEPQRIWIKGKFVTPVRTRNELRTRIYLRFLKEIGNSSEVQLA